MPKIVKADLPKKSEKWTNLKDVRPGQYFRFTNVTYEEALSGKDESQFCMVITTQPKKTGRVSIVSADGKSVQEKDDTPVIVHQAELHVYPAEIV